MLSSSGPSTRCPKRIRAHRAACDVHLMSCDDMREQFIILCRSHYDKRELAALLVTSRSCMTELGDAERCVLLDDQPSAVIDFWTRH